MRSSTRLRLLRGAGILLLALGIVHLLATPHIATLVRESASPASARWLTPPMLLNHILVGVLLIPLGYLTAHAAPHAVGGASCGAGCRTDYCTPGRDLASRPIRADGETLLFRCATVCLGRSSDRCCRHYIVGCCVRPMSLTHEASDKSLGPTPKAFAHHGGQAEQSR